MDNYHIPALLHQSISGLDIKPDGVYVDATFGGGGHSKEILKHLDKGMLIAFDQDIDAFENIIEHSNFKLIHSNYRYIKNFLSFHGIEKVDGILADLGISFHQVDDKKRGFSFMSDALLDMRMNTNAKQTAADILNNYTEEQLTSVFREYGELKNARNVSKAIISERNNSSFKYINHLVDLLSGFTNQKSENKFFAKVFQALRIELNQEMQALKDLLTSSIGLIRPNGRLVILSYHSLEDRLVKNFIRSGNFSGQVEKDIYGNFETPFKAVNKKVICPDNEEIKLNKRSRSAKLRIAKRLH